ncbi:hypothetical protein AB0D59_48090 [Streptomyces sp. NPDC048417]|uniref:hypothetical protein n=1 Tax=Streptomyces sp. NPDC048417 TaxID=3155387 RepID=UPI003447882C
MERSGKQAKTGDGVCPPGVLRGYAILADGERGREVSVKGPGPPPVSPTGCAGPGSPLM